MKLSSRIVALVVAALAVAFMPAAADKPARMAVVVSKTSKLASIEWSELQRIFLREKIQWDDGSEITVFQRPSVHPLYGAFARAAVRKSPGELAEHWLNIKLTRGIDPPKVCASAMLLKRYLERTSGGIGYLAEDEVDETVKVVMFIDIK